MACSGHTVSDFLILKGACAPLMPGIMPHSEQMLSIPKQKSAKTSIGKD